MKIAYLASSRYNWYNDKTYEILSSYGKTTKINEDEKNLENFDVIFAEFLTINASNLKKNNNQKLIIRTHGVEIYEIQLNSVNWNNIDWILGLSNHQINYLKSKAKSNIKCGLFFLPSPIQNISLKKKAKNKNIAFPAHITGRKGHDQIVEFLKLNPSYHIHVLGDVCKYGGPVWEYVLWNLNKNNLQNNITWVKKIDWKQMNDWYENMTYIWLPSVQEGQSRVLLEGMSKGLKPIIRNFAGADELWPKENIYASVSEIKNLLNENFNPVYFRDYVAKKFDYEIIKKEFKYFLEN